MRRISGTRMILAQGIDSGPLRVVKGKASYEIACQSIMGLVRVDDKYFLM